MNQTQLPVTRPFLPPLADFVGLLEGIWDRGHLTNHGPLVQELESRLSKSLIPDQEVLCVANGGLGLQLILRAMDIRGKVVTTPFSYVATTSCVLWENLDVSFADIHPNDLCIDPKAVEAVIDSDCEAIVATHVFGNPCDVEALQAIADRHGLALIYDAAHAYGVEHQGKSILSYGDASMVSTHATKLFQTVEGGFVTARDHSVLARIEWMRRFGHAGDDSFHGTGINAKMSEVHAAMGLAMMPHLPEILDRRRIICESYDATVNELPGVHRAFTLRQRTTWNYSYYPILFSDSKGLHRCIEAMNATDIFPRRYFHPSLDLLQMERTSGNCPVSQSICDRILCLPLYHQLDDLKVASVCETLARVIAPSEFPPNTTEQL